MQIAKKTMGWIQKPSAYQYSQQLNAKRKAMAQDFIDQQSSVATAIFTAQDSQTAGAVENTYTNLLAQAQEKAAAQAQSLTDSITKIA
jgi:hypothetical protein